MEDWGHEEFPIDLYFMDLDGTWGDSDNDGLYDSHGGELLADIYVARLIASNLQYHGGEEVALMTNYFDKNHRYRAGSLRLDDRGLAFIVRFLVQSLLGFVEFLMCSLIDVSILA